MFWSPSATILRVYSIKEYNEKFVANQPKILDFFFTVDGLISRGEMLHLSMTNVNFMPELFCRRSTFFTPALQRLANHKCVIGSRMQYRELCVYPEDWDCARFRKQSSRREKILASGREARVEELEDS